MATNIQSISENSPLTTPEIGDSEAQGTLPVGPTGRVHRGGGTVPWAKRCALTLTPSPSSKLLFMVLASYVNGPDEPAWPSQSTLATMTGLTARGVRNATKQLEAAGRIRVERMGGDRGLRYRLEAEVSFPSKRKSVPVEAEVSSPSRRKSVPVEAEVSSPEVLNEGTSTKAALPTVQKTGQKGSRHTCSCGNNWPLTFGPLCFRCSRKVGVSHPSGQAAPQRGKYDDLHDDAPRPDPLPPTPETVARLEADAVSNGYHKRAGQWTKTW